LPRARKTPSSQPRGRGSRKEFPAVFSFGNRPGRTDPQWKSFGRNPPQECRRPKVADRSRGNALPPACRAGPDTTSCFRVSRQHKKRAIVRRVQLRGSFDIPKYRRFTSGSVREPGIPVLPVSNSLSAANISDVRPRARRFPRHVKSGCARRART